MQQMWRKVGQSVVVGSAEGFEHPLTIKVLRCVNQDVILGFEVDISVPILRLELWRGSCEASRKNRKKKLHLKGGTDRIVDCMCSDLGI